MTTANDDNSERDPGEIREIEDPSDSPSSSPSADESCFYCPTGHYESGHTTITLERKDTTLVVKKVPAQVCWACGEALFAEETVDRLQDMMERAVSAELETAVCSYATESEQSSEENDVSQAQEEALPHE